jgi:hypothetical protein
MSDANLPDEPKRLWFTKGGHDITEGIVLRAGRALPGGWSSYQVWVVELGGECEIGVHIADLYCGKPINVAEGYGYRYE